MRHLSLGLLGIASALTGSVGLVSGAAVPFSAGGVAPATDNTNWVTKGYATLNGFTSGVDWTNSGQRENVDWTYMAGGGQGALASPGLEWPTAGSTGTFGFIGGSQPLGIGPSMIADIQASGGNTLRVAEVAPAAGTYTLNGVTQTATAVGQVLLWTSPISSFSAGDTMTFTSTAQDGNGNLYGDGPDGFSAVPEPATVGLIAVGILGLLRTRRCH